MSATEAEPIADAAARESAVVVEGEEETVADLDPVSETQPEVEKKATEKKKNAFLGFLGKVQSAGATAIQGVKAAGASAVAERSFAILLRFCLNSSQHQAVEHCQSTDTEKPCLLDILH